MLLNVVEYLLSVVEALVPEVLQIKHLDSCTTDNLAVAGENTVFEQMIGLLIQQTLHADNEVGVFKNDFTELLLVRSEVLEVVHSSLEILIEFLKALCTGRGVRVTVDVL